MDNQKLREELQAILTTNDVPDGFASFRSYLLGRGPELVRHLTAPAALSLIGGETATDAELAKIEAALAKRDSFVKADGTAIQPAWGMADNYARIVAFDALPALLARVRNVEAAARSAAVLPLGSSSDEVETAIGQLKSLLQTLHAEIVLPEFEPLFAAARRGAGLSSVGSDSNNGFQLALDLVTEVLVKHRDKLALETCRRDTIDENLLLARIAEDIIAAAKAHPEVNVASPSLTTKEGSPQNG